MNEWKKRLKDVREAHPKFRKKSDFARAVGVSPPTVTDWEKMEGGIAKISGENLVAVCKLLGIHSEWLIDGVGPRYDSVPDDYLNPSDTEPGPEIVGRPRLLPVVGRCQAGPDGLLLIDDYPTGHGEGIVEYWAKCDNAYALRIRGESMSPRYLPGEFVAVDPCTEVFPNQEVILLLKDQRRLIKRLLWIRDGQASFESINKDFQNITFELDEIEGMHRVMGRVPPEAFRQNN